MMRTTINILILLAISIFTTSCGGNLSTSQAVPTPSSSVASQSTNPVIAISAGGTHVCALLQNGEVMCWGDNSSGQLGDGTNTPHSVPIKVTNLVDAIAIAAGGQHTCAITKSDGVKCWGYNRYGQLGNGTKTMSNVPVNVTELSSPIISIAAGIDHTCAITREGNIKCWGKNLYGRLGDGSNSLHSTTPVDVINLDGTAVSITMGNEHTCVILDNGGVQCWGSNSSGQLGIGGNKNVSKTPEYVSDITSGANQISAGYSKTCATMRDGKLKCWGWIGSSYFFDTPTEISNLNGVISIAVGAGHICAVLQDGSVQCLGENASGELGNNSNAESFSPVRVNELNGEVTSIVANFGFTCILMKSGDVKCWGDNAVGQLGNGTNVNSSVPVDVQVASQ
jgi:alpha-tubulin suppressor-like RCC1 family protein